MFILSPILPGSLYILLMQTRERHVVTMIAQDFYSAVATTTKRLIYILSYPNSKIADMIWNWSSVAQVPSPGSVSYKCRATEGQPPCVGIIPRREKSR